MFVTRAEPMLGASRILQHHQCREPGNRIVVVNRQTMWDNDQPDDFAITIRGDKGATACGNLANASRRAGTQQENKDTQAATAVR